MKEKRPLLTISLLSCGRTKTIKKCLDSIVPLMQKVDSELIIVDTGCNEEIKELMRGYTDQFVSFTWCDDFSKARNAGLEKARGEWFMYLDDDEWFIDTKEIEDFFLSGEYKKYYFACYIQRNYLNYNKQVFTDTWVSRLVRLEKNVRFVSCIHEYFSPLSEPYKLLHSMVEHFGYIYGSKEEERKHIRRNVLLLQKMIRQETDTIRWWTHLANEYRAGEEYHQMQELCRKGLEHFKNFNDEETNRERGSFYCGLVEAELLSAYYEQAEKDVEAALLDKRNNQVCQTRLYNLGADACYRQGKYRESERYCEKYMEYYDRLIKDEKERQRQEAFFAQTAFEPAGRYSALCFYILSGLHLGKTEALKKYFWEFGWNGTLMLYNGFVGEVVDAMSRFPYEEEFVRMAETMANRPGLGDLWDKLLEIEGAAKEKPTPENQEHFYNLARIFSQITVPNHYVWYLKILYGDHIGNIENADECYEKMFHYVADIFQLDDKVFEIAQKYHVDLGAQFAKIPFDQWRMGVDAFFANSTYEKILDRTQIVRNSMPGEGAAAHESTVRYDYFFMKAAEADVIYGNNKDDLTALQSCLRTFSDRCLAFYGQFYKDSAFQGEMELLTKPCRAAVKIAELLEAYESGDRQRIGESLKAAVGVFPDFDPAFKAYTTLYAAEEKAKLAAASVSPEMRALAEQIKEKISALLRQGMTAESYQILQQLKSFVPDDPDIPSLEKQISMRFS
ncbi:MAG: glycosyltransferase [Lachnospiraceae bacterium]|nr:glycosyltransferase [Lachnospiraceae bacterium]